MGKTVEKDNPFGLTDKQLLFCSYYLGLVDGSEKETMFNGNKSAIAAGYKENNARTVASENLTKLDIQRHLSYLRAKIVKFQLRSPEALKTELENISVARVTDLLDIKSGLIKIGETEDKKPIFDLQQRIILKDSDDWGDLSSAISEISESKDGKIRIKLHNKTSAIETLMRLHDQFPKRVIKLPGPKDMPDEGTVGGTNYIFFLPEEGVELIPPDAQPVKVIKKKEKLSAADLIKQSITNNKKG